MEEMMKECANNECPRWGIKMTNPPSKKCISCGWKLTRIWRDSGHREPIGYLPANYGGNSGWGNGYRRETGWGRIDHRESTNDTWTMRPDLEGCPLRGKDEQLLAIPFQMYYNWVYLALRKDIEWIAYLKGVQDPVTGYVSLSEMYIPKQNKWRTSSGHCEALEREVLPGTIGAVHSHVDFSAFFSTEDRKHFNHPVEIVVNRRGDLLYAVRLKLKCREWSRVESRNYLLIGSDEQRKLAEELESKVVDPDEKPKEIGSGILPA